MEKDGGGAREQAGLSQSHVYTTRGTEDSIAGNWEGTRETLVEEEALDAKFPVQQGAGAGVFLLGSGCGARAYQVIC